MVAVAGQKDVDITILGTGDDPVKLGQQVSYQLIVTWGGGGWEAK